MNLIILILIFLLPPAAVFLMVGFTFHFWINLILSLLGYVPGIIHALWLYLSLRGLAPPLPRLV